MNETGLGAYFFDKHAHRIVLASVSSERLVSASGLVFSTLLIGHFRESHCSPSGLLLGMALGERSCWG